MLFNNAGVMLFGPIEGPATDQWQRQVDVNINGLNNAVAAFTPQLLNAAAERGGHDDRVDGVAVMCGGWVEGHARAVRPRAARPPAGPTGRGAGGAVVYAMRHDLC
ncbi:hypothetical protein ABZY09_49440 [Streptomyces sp. NPDC002928]|uniref:hypothetical protein n=1 Tax=Streptomyces sp. NPDC002928 TaxID=3154440 RepID=UPI0033A70BF1